MPKSKLDETLKKMAAATPPANTASSSNIEPAPALGDPECPYCKGLGYVRREIPLDSPDFGRLEACTCRHGAINSQVRERLFSLSHLDELRDLTFDTFKPRGRIGLGEMQARSLEYAYNTARQYATSLNGWLLLTGGYGSGKTHLAAAVANFAVGMGVPTLFLTVPDLLDLLRQAFDNEAVTFEERFEQVRSPALLVLDDFGTQSATPWAQEKLFQIINYRYINKLPLVVTTNIPLEDIEARIRSRLADPELVSTVRITAPDFRRPTEDLGHHELSCLHLFPRSTFANFSLREDEGLDADHVRSLERVLKAAIAFAAKPKGWLLLLGPYGSGKTHLAAAIGNARTDQGDPPLMIMVPDLLDELRSAMYDPGKTTFRRMFNDIRTTPLLILDDLGTQSLTPWAREKMHQLFNHRYNAELPTMITSANTLEEIDERIRARLLDARLCTIHAITAPAYHGGRRKKK